MWGFAPQPLNTKSESGSNRDRVRACRLIQQHPRMLGLIESGAIHLSAASLLFAHKDDGRFTEILRESTFKSARAIELILAKAFPKAGPVRENLRLMVQLKKMFIVRHYQHPAKGKLFSTPRQSHRRHPSKPLSGPEARESKTSRVGIIIFWRGEITCTGQYISRLRNKNAVHLRRNLITLSR